MSEGDGGLHRICSVCLISVHFLRVKISCLFLYFLIPKRTASFGLSNLWPFTLPGTVFSSFPHENYLPFTSREINMAWNCHLPLAGSSTPGNVFYIQSVIQTHSGECPERRAPPAGRCGSLQASEERRRVSFQSSLDGLMEAHSTGGNVGEKADVEMAGSPFEPYIESLRQQLEEQDPVFLIGVIVALAVVVITCGKKSS